MNILSADHYKLLKDKSLRILTLICIASSVGFGFMMKVILDMSSSGDDALDIFGMGLSGVAAPFIFIRFYSIVVICCGVFASTFIVSEFEKGTIRNALATGTGKAAYYFSKLYTQWIICLLLTVLSVVSLGLSMTIFIGPGSYPNGNYVVDVLVFMGAVMVQLLAYSSLFLMVSFLVRNTGGTIAICISFVTFESLIIQLLSVPDIPVLKTLAQNMPGSVLPGLSRFAETNAILTADFAKTIVSGIIIIIVSIPIGLITFMKRDVK